MQIHALRTHPEIGGDKVKQNFATKVDCIITRLMRVSEGVTQPKWVGILYHPSFMQKAAQGTPFQTKAKMAYHTLGPHLVYPRKQHMSKEARDWLYTLPLNCFKCLFHLLPLRDGLVVHQISSATLLRQKGLQPFSRIGCVGMCQNKSGGCPCGFPLNQPRKGYPQKSTGPMLTPESNRIIGGVSDTSRG